MLHLRTMKVFFKIGPHYLNATMAHIQSEISQKFTRVDLRIKNLGPKFNKTNHLNPMDIFSKYSGLFLYCLYQPNSFKEVNWCRFHE